ncbi:MAG: ferritin family protein [Deltaproteobacteria bacterium]|jgi:rubrerythrin|nr:ferritin family protein [Deltaproteobacteria bacterium]MBW2533779.1 ferritin family protein [Deltaproteobacteria bacterium]
MDETTKALIAGLRQAMTAERTGHTFYSMAAQNTDDPVGKEAFLQLAREETEHFQFLAAHYRSLVDQGVLSPTAKLRSHGDVMADSPIFSDDLKQRIKDAHFEMSALSIAVQLELNGINHYKKMAAEAKLPEVKKFFEDLAAWETSHYNALLRQQEALQDDYWSESGFAPF